VKSWGLALVLCSLVAAVAVPLASAVRLDSGTFDDPTGDSGAAPDIQRVLVGSHATAITLGLTFPNRQKLEGQDAVLIYLDTDGNEASGEQPNGADYMFLWDTEPQKPYALFRWDGARWVDTLSRSVRAYFYRGARISFNRADVGAPTAIRFWVETYVGEQLGDDAPNDAITAYTLSNEALKLRVAQFSSAAKRVKPGKRFTIGMKVHRNDLDEIATDGGVSCTAKVGKRVVKVTAGYPADVALCTGIAPRWAKGKTVKVTVTLALDGVNAKRTASIAVR
jgi:hypothetical protein